MAETKKAKKDDAKPAAAKPELKAVDKDAMPSADDLSAGDMGGGAEPAVSKKKLVIFVMLPVLILIGAVAGAYFLGYIPHFGAAQKVNCDVVKEGDKDYDSCVKELAQQASTPPPGQFVDINDMIVNLQTSSKQPRFLKISLKVEVETKDDAKAFEGIKPRVVDQFQTYLRELRLDDLKGSSGMYRMKLELLNRIRAAAPDIKVRDVLFQEILVQ
jgi:flagellar FliL protein